MFAQVIIYVVHITMKWWIHDALSFAELTLVTVTAAYVSTSFENLKAKNIRKKAEAGEIGFGFSIGFGLDFDRANLTDEYGLI